MDTGYEGAGEELDFSTIRLDPDSEDVDSYATIPLDEFAGVPSDEPTVPHGNFLTDPDLVVTPRQRRRSTGVMAILFAALTALVVGMAFLVAAADAAEPGDWLYPVDRAAEDFWLEVAPDGEAALALQTAFDEERIAEGVPPDEGESSDPTPAPSTVPAHPNQDIWIAFEEHGGHGLFFNLLGENNLLDLDDRDRLLDGDGELGDNLLDGDGLLGEGPLGDGDGQLGDIRPGDGELGSNLPGGGELGSNLPGGGELGGNLPGGGELGSNLPDIGDGDGGLGENLPNVGGGDLGDNLPDVGGGDLGDNLPDVGGDDGGLGGNLPGLP